MEGRIGGLYISISISIKMVLQNEGNILSGEYG